MAPTVVRIATRASALALWQANHIATLLRDAVPDIAVELIELSTEGDRRTDVPISVIGGKGVFAKEVQAAVLDGRADIAVHSAKDLPSETPPGLVIAAVPERADPRDVLIGKSPDELVAADAGVVATGAARRRVQLQRLNANLEFAELRGNIDTRLGKAPGFDAIVMAKAALDRLGRSVADMHVLAVDVMIPQVGQGTLAVECLSDADTLRTLLGRIEDPLSRRHLDAERGFLRELGGDCELPAGAHAVQITADECVMAGFLADMDGERFVSHQVQGLPNADLGRVLAARLRDDHERFDEKGHFRP